MSTASDRRSNGAIGYMLILAVVVYGLTRIFRRK
jgi:hypothetical protein